MPLPSKRDPGELRSRLTAWFESNVGPGVEIGELSIPEGTGMSSETLLFDLTHDGVTRPVVTRMRPDMSDFPVFPVYDLDGQRRAMELVAERTDVPVPEVLWFEPDAEPLGAPFFVMGRINGSAPPDMPPYVFGGSFLDAMNDDERMALQANAAGVLARLHTITYDESGNEAMERQLQAQREYYDWAREGVRYPAIEAMFDWLEANKPDFGPTVLNWGDSRIGNILFNGTEVAAVLDWEMVDRGPAEVDVAWMSFLHTFFQSMATNFGFPGMPALMRPDDLARQYEAAGGRRLERLDWFEAYACLRFASISVRTSLRAISYGDMEPAPADDPDSLIMHRGLLQAMLDGSYWSN